MVMVNPGLSHIFVIPTHALVYLYQIENNNTNTNKSHLHAQHPTCINMKQQINKNTTILNSTVSSTIYNNTNWINKHLFTSDFKAIFDTLATSNSDFINKGTHILTTCKLTG